MKIKVPWFSILGGFCLALIVMLMFVAGKEDGMNLLRGGIEYLDSLLKSQGG